MSNKSSQLEKLAEGGQVAGASAHNGSSSENSCALKSRPWHLAIAGAVAAVLTWFLVMPHYSFLTYVHQGTMFAPDPGEVETLARYRFTNPSLLFAAIAASSAVAFAIAEGLARRSMKFAALAAISGAVLSSGIGAAGGWLAEWVFELPLHRLVDLAKSVVVQATCWSLVGLGVGLGFSLPTWRRRVIGAASVGAVAGGLLASLLYGPASAIFAQMADTDALVPKHPIHRLTWLGTAVIFIGCATASLARMPAPLPRPRLPPADDSSGGS